MATSLVPKAGLLPASHCLSRPRWPACMPGLAQHGQQAHRHSRPHQQSHSYAASTCSRPRPHAPRRQVPRPCASAAAGAVSVSTQSMDDGAAQRSPLMNDIFGGLTTAVVALPLALAFGVASGNGCQRTAVPTVDLTSLATTVAGHRPVLNTNKLHCMSAGLGPLAGLYGSIFVGFFAAIFGGAMTVGMSAVLCQVICLLCMVS
jgi:hypothetical protein